MITTTMERETPMNSRHKSEIKYQGASSSRADQKRFSCHGSHYMRYVVLLWRYYELFITIWNTCTMHNHGPACLRVQVFRQT